jgi:hypothetical protein
MDGMKRIGARMVNRRIRSFMGSGEAGSLIIAANKAHNTQNIG